jgi:hypothetical protein
MAGSTFLRRSMMIDTTGFLQELQTWLDEARLGEHSKYGGLQLSGVFVEGSSLCYDHGFEKLVEEELQNRSDRVVGLSVFETLEAFLAFLGAVFDASLSRDVGS